MYLTYAEKALVLLAREQNVSPFEIIEMLSERTEMQVDAGPEEDDRPIFTGSRVWQGPRV